MAINPYFNNFHNQTEQGLVEDLIIESIKMYGMDMWYLPRKGLKYDELYHEDDSIFFDKAYEVEMYIKEVDDFGGQGDFLSKFGLQINETTTLTVAEKRFDIEVGRYEDFSRPREGDLIYFPLDEGFFKISYVEDKSVFFQLGKLFVFDLKIEKFEYSNERIKTGVAMIDEAIENFRQVDVKTIDELNDMFGDMSDNKILEDEGSNVLDFSETNPFGSSIY